MSFKMVKPFIFEMVTFLFVIITVSAGLIAGNFIELRLHMHLLTISAIICVFFGLISLFSRIINTGVRALMDFLFQRTKEDCYIFLKEQPYQASVFTEIFASNHKLSYGMYYLIHLKKGKEIFTCISSSYIDLKEGESYIIKMGSSSKIFIDSKRQ